VRCRWSSLPLLSEKLHFEQGCDELDRLWTYSTSGLARYPNSTQRGSRFHFVSFLAVLIMMKQGLLYHGAKMKDVHPDDILAESFRIIDAEVGAHSFGPLEWPVVRRMIHAAGDLGLAQLVHFSPGAVEAGVQALRMNGQIVTDARMVAHGLQRESVDALGLDIHCFVDHPDARTEAGARGVTRSAWGIERAVGRVPEAVFAIGNAPTALSALCAAIRRGEARPPLVLAMPVGFVGVLESKEEALRLPVPIIAVRGRRGGSAIAAAAVNALMLLAREGAG
jgi:precorrin-8X/cobalt-precorrin-8 methylmutase